MTRPEPAFTNIVPHFCFEGEFIRAEPHGFGHINDTYAAYFRRASGKVHRHLMQCINRYVFRDIEGLMQNIAAVTTHLHDKIVAAGGNPDRETLTLIPTTEAKTFYETPGGDFWRAYMFIEGARTYEAVESLEHIYSAGRAFGNFQKLLADFPAEQLVETIPGFHHTKRRFDAFVQAVERDIKNRAHTVRPEIEFVERRVKDTSVLLDLLEQGILPSRVTHNDTKFNNVMIDDESGEGVCVVDLDTVMPGLSLYDFGDAVRYAANPAAEDERDLSKVCIDLEIYEYFARGFLDSARSFLTPKEVDHLPFSAKLMTLECGMRFLTDYLDGDFYFKTHRENHNLDRCRTQFKMVEDMEARFDQMEQIVDRYR
jgi:Ser/Thr protein kinase RdoA (MazF antagonist)